MLPVEDIIRTAYGEHEHDHAVGSQGDLSQFVQRVRGQLDDHPSIPPFSKSSPPFSLVRFRCLLQDTGYPMEVYLGDAGDSTSDQVDWNQLKERWVGWGVEVPGEQQWAKSGGSSVDASKLPKSVHSKYPLPREGGQYLGALVKVYDDVTFKPASVHEFVGVVSTSPLPSVEPESAEYVPTIHVVEKIEKPEQSEPDEGDAEVREELLEYLGTAFDPPDSLAAEFLLLLLLSSPSSRPIAMPPLGTLSVNFRRRSSEATAPFRDVVSEVTPRVVPLPLTISLLHSHPFIPSSIDSSSLDAGLLQLGEGTVLIVEEDSMGSGGSLNDKALNNLKALAECITEQRVRYQYPFMDSLKMDCATRVAVLSQGKSLLPVDIDIPIRGEAKAPLGKLPELDKFRSYLARYSSTSRATRLVIPDDTAQVIQDDFVQDRKRRPDAAEEALKRRMKVARLLALSYPEGELTGDVWKQAVRMDEEVDSRHTFL